MAASNDIVIVNFEALESAINSFGEGANRILDISANITANASAIQGAIVSQAADTYVAKENALAKNVGTAKELLDKHVTELTSKLEEARSAEVKATTIAEGVTTYPMQ